MLQIFALMPSSMAANRCIWLNSGKICIKMLYLCRNGSIQLLWSNCCTALHM